MGTHVIFDATGKIERVVDCPDSMATRQVKSGESIIPGVANDNTQYVVAGVITDKPPMTTAINTTTVPADGVTPITITGAPIPCNFEVTGPANYFGSDPDGTLQLTFNLAGTYTVKLEAFPYLPMEYTINAT